MTDDIWYREYLAVAAQLDAMTQERDDLRELLKEALDYIDDPYNDLAISIGAALKGDDRE